MSFREWLRPSTWTSLARKPQPAGTVMDRIARLVPTWSQGKPVNKRFDIIAFGDEGLRKNAVISACIAEILSTVSEPKLVVNVVGKNGDEVQAPSDHPLVALLKKPNPEYSQAELIERIVLNAQLCGEWYVHKVRDQRGALAELWPLRPDRIAPVSGDTPETRGLISAYAFRQDSNRTARLSPADIIRCIVNPDFLDEYSALPPLSAIASWVALDNEATHYLLDYFSNSAQPAGYLKFKRVTDPSDRERARQIWAEAHGRGSSVYGQSNFHKTGVLDEDVQYMETGQNPGELKLDNIFDESESRICAAFGISPILVAMRIGLKQMSYANAAHARASLWEEKLIPLYGKIADKLTVGLAQPEFGDNLVIRFDTSEVMALQEDLAQIGALQLEGWKAKVLTRNEIRPVFGVAPLPDTDPRGGQFYEPGGTPAAVVASEDPAAIPDITKSVNPIPAVSVADADAGNSNPVPLPPDPEAQRRVRLARFETMSKPQLQKIRALMKSHFKRQGPALAAHLKAAAEKRGR